MNLTVGELLASAPAVEKQLTKAICEDEAVQFRVSTLSSGEALEATKPGSWCCMGAPKAEVDAEINLMTRELMEDAG